MESSNSNQGTSIPAKRSRQRVGDIQQAMAEALKKYGWIAHLVWAEDGVHANYHTHGLAENFQHPDLQCTLPIDPAIVHELFALCVRRIQSGQVFQAGQRYEQILQEESVLFLAAKENERAVLRLVLPDAQGRFPGEDGCDPIYQSQGDGAAI